MTPAGDLDGRTALVTGANAGIGLATAEGLAGRGAAVLMHGRDPAKLEAARREVAAGACTPPRAFVADFARLEEVARLADEVRAASPQIDLLVNNAGFIQDRFELTDDGVEKIFQVNHLAPFLLTLRLIDALAGARVITLASSAHANVDRLPLDQLVRPARHRPFDVYARSKACNILFTAELARRTRDLFAFAVHPGVVATRFARDGDTGGWLRGLVWFLRPLMRTPERGADGVLWLAGTDAPPPSGTYVADRKPRAPKAFARDPDTAAALWALSEELVAPHLATEGRHERAG